MREYPDKDLLHKSLHLITFDYFMGLLNFHSVKFLVIQKTTIIIVHRNFSSNVLYLCEFLVQ